ncbi:MAG: DNA recombination protein RmuC [Planctomycetaceae bacterium]
MESALPLLALSAGLAMGAAVAWWVQKQRIQHACDLIKGEQQAELATLTERLTSLESLNRQLQETRSELTAAGVETTALKQDIARLQTSLDEERKQGNEKLELLRIARANLTETFQSLAAEALSSNNDSFLKLATTKLKPVEKSIEKFDDKVQDLEKAREGAYEGLRQQVKGLAQSQDLLRKEASNLSSALRSPTVRGRWGEIQLKRVVELAGMLEYCDFREQQQTADGDGRGVRPDLLVQLPAGKTIIVDSKVPLNAYLESLEATDEATRQEKLIDHANSVRSHVRQLSGKSYFEHFDHTPEFVVLFIASEAFFSAALEHDPELIEQGVEKNVIIATPTTLIALLRAVAYGWRQEQLAENAKKISDLGRNLYKRLATMGEHMAKLGKHLNAATEAYNQTVGSLESRVMVTARKFPDLRVDAPGVEVEPLDPVDATPRRIQAPEFLSNSADDDDAKQLTLH